jgi:hypothetical protein
MFIWTFFGIVGIDRVAEVEPACTRSSKPCFAVSILPLIL